MIKTNVNFYKIVSDNQQFINLVHAVLAVHAQKPTNLLGFLFFLFSKINSISFFQQKKIANKMEMS